YDDDGRLRYTVVDAGTSAYGATQSGEVTETRYDAFGGVTATVQYAQRMDLSAFIDANGQAGGLLAHPANTTDTNAVSALNAFASAHGADAANRVTTFAYTDNRGLLTQTVEDYGGAGHFNFTTTDSYNAFGELSTVVTDVGSAHAGTGAATRSDVYSYTKRGQVKQVAVDNGGLGLVTQKVYDAYGAVIQVTDPNLNITKTVSDNLGRESQTIEDYGTTGHLNLTTITTYDAFNRVLTIQDRDLNTVTYSYTDNTRTAVMTSAEGITVATVKNREGQTVSVTDGNGMVTSYTYDADGNLKTTTIDSASGGLQLKTTQNYADADLLSSTVDANNVITTYTYDAARRVLSKTVDPAGLALTTSFGYDAFGEAAQVTDPNGITTTTVFDNEGRSAAVIVDSVSTGLRLATTYTYDAQGHTLTKVEGQQGTYNSTTKLWSFALAPNTDSTVTTSSTYDKAGRLTTEVVDPANLKITTQYFYDKNGNLTRKIDANLQTWRYAYDAANRLRYAFDPLGGVTQTDYDGEGRKIYQVQYATAYASLGSLTDTTTAASLTTAINALSNTAQDRCSWWVYDRDGNLDYTVDAVGDVTGYKQDGDGRVTQTTRFATQITSQLATLGNNPTSATIQSYVGTGNPAVDEISHIVYDAAGRAVATVDALNNLVVNGYDGNGNLVRSTAYANPYTYGVYTASAVMGHLPAADSAHDRVTAYAYDNANRLRFKVDAVGSITETLYDNDGRVVQTIKHAVPINTAGLPAVPKPSDVLKALYSATFADDFGSGNLSTNYLLQGGGIQEANNSLVFTAMSGVTSYAYGASSRIATIGSSGAQLYRAEITPTSPSDTYYFGASNSGNTVAQMAYFGGNGAIQNYTYNGGGAYTNTGLTYQPGVTYIVEVVVSAAGSTLYVYQKGQPRSSGYQSDRK